MDTTSTVLAGTTLSSVIVGVCFLIYKYLSRHRVKVGSGCCKLLLETDRTPNSNDSPDSTDSYILYQ
jgi:hypothetical protein